MGALLPSALTNDHTPAFGLEPGLITEVHAFWLAGMSCDGCSVAVLGAVSPSVEQLLTGAIPGLPKVILHHPVLSVEVGHEFMKAYHLAKEGKLGAPYVVIYEGSVANEDIAQAHGGYWSGMGSQTAADGTPQPIPTAHWLRDLAPGAAATFAIGTCATWGGVPAAAGNVTGSMSVMDYLGKDHLSALGLPVINVPGCSPIGDNFTETVAVVLMFLAGVGPLPAFDELGRPAWMFTETVHRGCVRGGYYEEGTFAKNYGDPQCLVTLGCWGPIVQCNIVSRGAIGSAGGCMNTGGICIGCTMPGFPDAFAPFYKAPPGKTLSSGISRAMGSFIRPLRRITQRKSNLTGRWNKSGHIPSGWGHVEPPGPLFKAVNYFYRRLQYSGPYSPASKRQQLLQAEAHSFIGESKRKVEEEASV